jgi:uncharacterized protein YggE
MENETADAVSQPPVAPSQSAQPAPSRHSRLVPALAATAGAALLGVALLGGLALGTTPSASSSTQRQTNLISDNSPSTSSGATVTVTATGQVSGAPDTVTLQLGVNANGSSASSALDNANNDMQRLQNVFLSHGVSRPQLQTSGLNLNPNYNNSGVIDGYSANEQLTVTMHAITKAGELIDAGTHAVGNDAQLNGVTFSISNTSKLLQAARAQAMQNAQLEAQQIATGAGVSLGAIKSVVDQEQPPPPTYYPVFGDASGAVPSANRVPLEGGKQQLSIQVQVIYYLGK